MKVCWVAPNGGHYLSTTHIGSGGWVAALEKALVDSNSDIQLSIIFPTSFTAKTKSVGSVTYHPIRYSANSKISIFLRRISSKFLTRLDNNFITDIYNKIEEINPDIVHIWGVENLYARIVKRLDRPHVVHIQGFASSIYDHFLPSGVSPTTLRKYDGLLKHYILRQGLAYKYFDFKRRVDNELDLVPYVNNWIGRTEWDRATSACLNSAAHYFHCDELIRDEYKRDKWRYHYDGKLIISSIVGEELYKGIELVLKTASILKKRRIEFEWNLYGVGQESKIVKFFEHLTNIHAQDVSVFYRGRRDPASLAQCLLDSDMYVHTSHIENSSNAVAEAMSLGMPIIAMCVGGNPTMLNDASGLLIQPNDPNVLAISICKLLDSGYASVIAGKSYAKAAMRHDTQSVVSTLTGIYQEIIKNNIKKV